MNGIVNQAIDTVKAVLTGRIETVGMRLIKKFDLSNYQYSYIQKVIGYKLTYVITVDSRFPDKYIAYGKIRNIESFKIGMFDTENIFKQFKLTPPIELKDFNIKIPSLTLLIVRDMAAEYFIDKVKEG